MDFSKVSYGSMLIDSCVNQPGLLIFSGSMTGLSGLFGPKVLRNAALEANDLANVVQLLICHKIGCSVSRLRLFHFSVFASKPSCCKPFRPKKAK